jgi:hypothetical protein
MEEVRLESLTYESAGNRNCRHLDGTTPTLGSFERGANSESVSRSRVVAGVVKAAGRVDRRVPSPASTT